MTIETVSSLQAYARAQERLLALISGDRKPARSTGSRRQRAEARLSHIRRLLATFSNPHQQYPVVHVTGTSGKGSTSAAIAAILTAAGYRVGLRTSPYLQVATEKLQLGPRLIAADSLDDLSATVLAAHERLSSSGVSHQRLGYAEAWTVLALLWFAEQQVDVAIVEVGAGGRFDATNVVEPTVSVITSIGLDHVASLGPTIDRIAWHKAGIIKPGATAVVGTLPAEAWSVVDREVRLTGAKLIRSSPLPATLRGSIGMNGAFQQANAQVAVAAIDALRLTGISVADSAVRRGLAAARLPGRLELMPGDGGSAVWIDGAHNADKIRALANELPFRPGQLTGSHTAAPPRLPATRAPRPPQWETPPSMGGGLGGEPGWGEGKRGDVTISPSVSAADVRRPVVLLGVLSTKDVIAIASGLSPIASAIVTSEPEVTGKTALPASELAGAIRACGFRGPIHVEPDPASAVRHAESLAQSQGSSVLVTGSMYLAGQVRRRWYPDADIIVQQTPWPGSPDGSESAQALPDRSVAL